jgi:hypothetical protein
VPHSSRHPRPSTSSGCLPGYSPCSSISHHRRRLFAIAHSDSDRRVFGRVQGDSAERGCLFRTPSCHCSQAATTVCYRPMQPGSTLALPSRGLHMTLIIHTFQTVLQEAVLWRQLIHPFVVPFLGVSIVSERLCLLSPWLPFGNLRQYLQQHGPGEPREIIVGGLSDSVWTGTENLLPCRCKRLLPVFDISISKALSTAISAQ